MCENKQRVCVSFLIMMVVIVSISQTTKGNKDLAFAPVSEEGLLPNPMSCVKDATKIPNCVDAVKQFHLKNITKECCIVLLGVPEDCFGIMFPMRLVYRVMLKITCKLINFNS